MRLQVLAEENLNYALRTQSVSDGLFTLYSPSLTLWVRSIGQ